MSLRDLPMLASCVPNSFGIGLRTMYEYVALTHTSTGESSGPWLSISTCFAIGRCPVFWFTFNSSGHMKELSPSYPIRQLWATKDKWTFSSLILEIFIVHLFTSQRVCVKRKLFLPSQIISHYKNLGEWKFFKFNQI